MRRVWLIELREELKLTQKNLADLVGVTRQMISAIENGAGTKTSTAKKIASVLGFSWTRFFEDQKVKEESHG